MTVPAWRVRGVGRGQRRVQGCVIWVCDVCCARSCMGARGGGRARGIQHPVTVHPPSAPAVATCHLLPSRVPYVRQHMLHMYLMPPCCCCCCCSGW